MKINTQLKSQCNYQHFCCIRDAFDKNGDGQVTPIDMQITKLATQIGEDCGPVAKIAFLKSAKYLL